MLNGNIVQDEEKLCGTISVEKSLNGVITGNSKLSGKVSVSVRDVPYYETSNSYGGTTVYIGKEVPK